MKPLLGLLFFLTAIGVAHAQSQAAFAKVTSASQAIESEYAAALAAVCPGPTKNNISTGLPGNKMSIEHCDAFQVTAIRCVNLAISAGTYLVEIRSGITSADTLLAEIDRSHSNVGLDLVAVSIAESAPHHEGATRLMQSQYRECMSYIR